MNSDVEFLDFSDTLVRRKISSIRRGYDNFLKEKKTSVPAIYKFENQKWLLDFDIFGVLSRTDIIFFRTNIEENLIDINKRKVVGLPKNRSEYEKIIREIEAHEEISRYSDPWEGVRGKNAIGLQGRRNIRF